MRERHRRLPPPDRGQHMRLVVYCRHGLVDQNLPADHPALLLEGSWHADEVSDGRRSLDEAIDGKFGWIDRQAAQHAQRLGETHGTSNVDGVSTAFLNALALRYYLVKLIRPIAYFSEVRPLRPGDQVELVATSRDRDYGDVLAGLCRAADVPCRVRITDAAVEPGSSFPPNPCWRRRLARLSLALHPSPDRTTARPNVVLCGNPRLLDPVCRELLARRCHLWWLYDRFALKSWLRWQAPGVRQLVCNSSLGRENRLANDSPERLDCRGIDLAGPVGRWLARRAATHGPRQTRLVEQIGAHFRDVRPTALVVDEDATPLPRAAVAAARCWGARSFVVQHGVPCCRFGFTPPLADRVLVWGESSRRRLADWGVPSQQIYVTGSTPADHLLCRRQQSEFRTDDRHAGERKQACRRRILLLTSVPPRDDRPDAVALHLTGHSYAQMLRFTCATVAGIDGVELVVKVHPRVPNDPVAAMLRTEFPSLRHRVVRSGSVARWLTDVDCVLSCGSSAGVEATLAGMPVIQLAPPGASDTLPYNRWGMIGTARDQRELERLLTDVLVPCRQPAEDLDPQVFADLGQSAAARIAEEVLSATHDNQHTEPQLVAAL